MFLQFAVALMLTGLIFILRMTIAIVLQIWDKMVRYCLPSRAATFKDTLSVAKSVMQISRSFRFKFVLVWKYGMKYG